LFDKLWKIRRDGGVIAYFKKRKIQGGGGVLSEIPSVVGVWIFSGTTQSNWPFQKLEYQEFIMI